MNLCQDTQIKSLGNPKISDNIMNLFSYMNINLLRYINMTNDVLDLFPVYWDKFILRDKYME